MHPKIYDDDRNKYFIKQYLLLMEMKNNNNLDYLGKINYLKNYVENKKDYVEVYSTVQIGDITLIHFLNKTFEKYIQGGDDDTEAVAPR